VDAERLQSAASEVAESLMQADHVLTTQSLAALPVGNQPLSAGGAAQAGSLPAVTPLEKHQVRQAVARILCDPCFQGAQQHSAAAVAVAHHGFLCLDDANLDTCCQLRTSVESRRGT
jgi:hypothetical protein